MEGIGTGSGGQLYIDQETEPTKQDADRSPASCRPQNTDTDNMLRYVNLQIELYACFSNVDAQAKSVLYCGPKSTKILSFTVAAKQSSPCPVIVYKPSHLP